MTTQFQNKIGNPIKIIRIMKTQTQNKLKYESLEEELAQFKDERANPIKMLFKDKRLNYDFDFYKILIVFTAISNLLLIYIYFIS
jgi:hypothetical protein